MSMLSNEARRFGQYSLTKFKRRRDVQYPLPLPHANPSVLAFLEAERERTINAAELKYATPMLYDQRSQTVEQVSD